MLHSIINSSCTYPTIKQWDKVLIAYASISLLIACTIFSTNLTGEVKKKQVKYYPEEYKDCIGKSYKDYIESKQMNIFEFLDEYTGQSYSDLKEETPREETGKIHTYSTSEFETEDSNTVNDSVGAAEVE